MGAAPASGRCACTRLALTDTFWCGTAARRYFGAARELPGVKELLREDGEMAAHPSTHSSLTARTAGGPLTASPVGPG